MNTRITGDPTKKRPVLLNLKTNFNFGGVQLKARQVTDVCIASKFWMVVVKKFGEGVEGDSHNLT
jgi:hypothetical protein